MANSAWPPQAHYWKAADKISDDFVSLAKILRWNLLATESEWKTPRILQCMLKRDVLESSKRCTYVLTLGSMLNVISAQKSFLQWSWFTSAIFWPHLSRYIFYFIFMRFTSTNLWCLHINSTCTHGEHKMPYKWFLEGISNFPFKCFRASIKSVANFSTDVQNDMQSRFSVCHKWIWSLEVSWIGSEVKFRIAISEAR